MRFDPWNPNRFLSLVEDGGVKVWDLRQDRSRRPLTALLPQGGRSDRYLQASWCPARSGIIGVAERESSKISLWDVDGGASGSGGEGGGEGSSGRSRQSSLSTTPWMPSNTQEPGPTLASLSNAPSRTLRTPWVGRSVPGPVVGFTWPMGRRGPEKLSRWNRVVTVSADGALHDVCLVPALSAVLPPGPSESVTEARGRAARTGAATMSLSSEFAPDIGRRIRARLKAGVGVDAAENERICAEACARLRKTGERAAALDLAERILGGVERGAEEGGSEEQEMWATGFPLASPFLGSSPSMRGHEAHTAGALPPLALPPPFPHVPESPLRAGAGGSPPPAALHPSPPAPATASAIALLPPPSAVAAGAVDAGCAEGAYGGEDKELLHPTDAPPKWRATPSSRVARRRSGSRSGPPESSPPAAEPMAARVGRGFTPMLPGASLAGPGGEVEEVEESAEASAEDIRFEIYRFAREVQCVPTLRALPLPFFAFLSIIQISLFAVCCSCMSVTCELRGAS